MPEPETTPPATTEAESRQRLNAIRARMAAPGPTPEELAAGDAEDRALVPRIHAARPGVPTHHILATLQTLRALRAWEATKEPAPAPAAPVPGLRDDPRALALAQARHRGWHVSTGRTPQWTDLPPRDRELVLKEARDWLGAAVTAGLIPPAEAPSDDHLGVWMDEEGFLYVDYPTSGGPGDDYVVRMVTANAEAVSRRDLEDTHGATFTRLGWCQ